MASFPEDLAEWFSYSLRGSPLDGTQLDVLLKRLSVVFGEARGAWVKGGFGVGS